MLSSHALEPFIPVLQTALWVVYFVTANDWQQKGREIIDERIEDIYSYPINPNQINNKYRIYIYLVVRNCCGGFYFLVSMMLQLFLYRSTKQDIEHGCNILQYALERMTIIYYIRDCGTIIDIYFIYFGSRRWNNITQRYIIDDVWCVDISISCTTNII